MSLRWWNSRLLHAPVSLAHVFSLPVVKLEEDIELAGYYTYREMFLDCLIARNPALGVMM